MLPMLSQLLRQMLKKPATNKFPAKYAPKNVKKFLEGVQQGKIKIIPPVELPPWFRGKIAYDKEKCIGCRACIKVCPAKAIEFKEEEKKIRIYVGRCIFCSQCNDVCPTNALNMSKDFLLASDNKLEENLIIE